MTLLAPWALWFGVLGAAVIALYLLKIKRRQATVPALDFWLALAGKTRVHSLFERLKRLLSMLLWLCILACLVLALGNPIFSAGKIKPRAIAIVLDNSASMQTLEPEPVKQTRLALAQAAITELATRRPVNDEWLLIEAARQPRVLHPWTFDTKSIRRAGMEVAPFGGSGNLAAGIELAGALLVGKPDPCIVVISDGGGGALEPLAKADPRIVHWPIGRTIDNLGISRLAVRADRQHGNYPALIAVANSSDQKIETQVTLQLDNATHSVELVTVEPHGVWEKTVVIDEPTAGDGTVRNGGVLRASLDRADALPLDNEAFAIIQPIRPAVIWLVSPADSAFFFEQALASMEPLVWTEESVTMTLERYEEMSPVLASPAAVASSPIKLPDLVIFNNCAPKSLPPAGRFVLINGWPQDIPAAVTGTLEMPRLFLASRPHPMMQHVTLQGARLAKASRVTLREPVRVLAHSAEGDPLMLLVEQPNRQTLCLAFDVLDSDLPFRNAFPLLLRNAVAYFQDESPSWIRPEFHVGELIEPVRALPSGLTSVTLGIQRDGKNEDRTLAVERGRFVVADTGRPGSLRVKIGEEWSYAAISLADGDESRIEPLLSAEDPAKKLVLSGRLVGALPWIALAGVAALVVALEWLTYHLRWTE
jgi:hypothetical protein